MKKATLTAASLLSFSTLAGSALAGSALAGSAFAAPCPTGMMRGDQCADVGTQRVELKGTVSQVTLGGGRIVLRTAQGDRTVHLAPAWFLTQNNMEVSTGDTLVVQALGGDMASEEFAAIRIQKDKQFLRLRKEDGRAAWTGDAYSSRNITVDSFE